MAQMNGTASEARAGRFRHREDVNTRVTPMRSLAVDLWWLRADRVAPTVLDALLSDDERRTTSRGLCDPRVGSRRAARALLRVVAAERLQCHPLDIEVKRRCARCGARDHGRPYVPGAPFGLSSATTSAVAVVAAGPPAIGVDVVMRSEADVAIEGAPVVLRPDVAATLAGMRHERGEAALHALAQVEAYAKATGLGLPAVAGQVAVSLDPSRPSLDAAGRTWLAQRADLDPEHIAVLVTEPSASGIFVRPATRLFTEPTRRLRAV